MNVVQPAANRPGPSKGSAKIVFTPNEVAERRTAVVALAAEGLNDHEIGRRLGVSKTTVAKDRRLLGIEPHSQGQPPKSPLPDEAGLRHLRRASSGRKRQT